MAAKIPANLAMSKGFLTAAGAAPGAATAVVVASALAVRFSNAAASFSSADLVNFSLHQRPNLRYGDQKASRTLMGFSLTWVMTASQSWPLLS